jgi:hypothetical protein
MMIRKSAILLAGLLFLFGHTIASEDMENWTRINGSELRLKGPRIIVPEKCDYYFVYIPAVAADFASADDRRSSLYDGAGKVVSLPVPGGDFQRFVVIRNSLMPLEMQDKYPFIRTYTGVGIDDPTATARIDFTDKGMHVMVLSSNGTYLIDPVTDLDTDHYQVYYKRDHKPVNAFHCDMDSWSFTDDPSPVSRSNGTQLKTYRLAMACTGEYTTFHGGTIAQALSAIITSVNRVEGIYEREFAVNFTLVPNTDTLIFLNPATDPYTNNSGFAMLSQNQSTCDLRIGSSNYDIGHVFSTGGGGIASLGSVCKVASKARGVTGLASPVGDVFDVDYVSHEMGHQFGGNHTFNSTTGACNGNRAFTAAYEPGSGSTIMAYAGICGSNNLQSNSDDYFHTKSFDEIVDYITVNAGGVCPQVVPTGNTAPSINAGGNYVIPYLTPFRLTGSASDPDGDTLTYCWEQFDLGPAGNWNAPSLNAPTFRSFDPVPDPVRIFPRLLNILNNTSSVGEVLPSYGRTLHFRLTVRDNRAGGGGVTYNDTLVEVEVIDTGTPFSVTSQNTTGIKWDGGNLETVTWDVGGSDQPPVSTPNVNILLSTDGGLTFPFTLASAVPNNGSAQVTVPFVVTTNARIMVEGDGNIFFDINDEDFEIGVVGINEIGAHQLSVTPNPANDHIEIKYSAGVHDGSLSIHDLTGRLVWQGSLGAGPVSLDVSEWSEGAYFIRLIDDSNGVMSGKFIVQ